MSPLPSRIRLDGLGTGLVVVGFLHQLELVGVDTFLGADFLDGLDVAHQGGVDNTFVDGGTHGANSVVVVGISGNQSFLSFSLDQFQKVV